MVQAGADNKMLGTAPLFLLAAELTGVSSVHLSPDGSRTGASFSSLATVRALNMRSRLLPAQKQTPLLWRRNSNVVSEAFWI